jgi:lysophospholipase L1-like esterase
MTRLKLAFVLTAALVVLASVLTAVLVVAPASARNDAHVRGVVLFLGDSNLTRAAGELETALTDTNFNDSYVPALASRPGAGMRTKDCPGIPLNPCLTYNYWSIRMPQILKRVEPDVVVVNLGVNDTSAPGTRTSQGYASYDTKIDAFIRLLPTVPIIWTNLPCRVEPPAEQPGCPLVNQALSAAQSRWPRLTVVDWGRTANRHPEWLLANTPHFKPAGYTAWAKIVVTALNAKLKL